ncbi:oligopeptide ABC transporter substrate-binding protein [Fructilactobacillus florum]|uniref:ABC transporter, substrate-binding protein, family 5 n=1 Tax=Fructilactobacillus florum DSM 22689 = JCM 16035 TaxID=1423745 RepID=A0A0R2CET7_9LACO|nr:oligopeptide ABC transporter substrate-binding protein [Fructilactobacillus florum]KRM90225.1 ABC transporter, substrate-binding protein, family 5 [Fructilactobacillus florum DSM 22689 = JCM 16035]
MNKYRKWAVMVAMTVVPLTLAACSNDQNATVNPNKLKPSYSAQGSSDSKANQGTLKLAEVNNSPFAGISSPTLSTNAEDSDVFSPGGEQPGSVNSLFKTDSDYKIIDGGMANQRIDRNRQTVTITLRKNAKWSNGSPVTAKDIEYPYEIIANPNTKSQQYSSDFENIKGMADYHAGTAKTISGIEMPEGENGKKVVIHVDRVTPSMQYAGNSFIWGSVEPYAYIKDVPIDKLTSAPQIRKKPIFTGPYKLDSMVQGESTSWSPNKYYYGKQAKIKHINIQVVSSNNIAAALKAKKYDFTLGGLGANNYPDVAKLKDYKITGNPGNSYNYFGFNLGHMDPKTNQQVTDPNMKMSNKKLRQAMMYAIDVNTPAKKFGHGLTARGNTLIPPIFKDVHDKNIKGYSFDQKKAEKLLDEAGYKKKGKWRTQPNGKPLEINFGVMQSSKTVEATMDSYVQNWRKIGLNVKYAGGKPMEMNSFYEALQAPKQDEMDIYAASWSVGSEPTPTQLYGADAAYNMGHFSTPENTKLLNSLNNEQSWNKNYRKQQYSKWQRYMNDQAAYVPETYRTDWVPVNSKLKNYNSDAANNQFWSNLEFTK